MSPTNSEDDIIFWQDHLEAVMNSRPDKVPKCPFCKTGTVVVTKDPPKTRLECGSCHHFVEGRFGEAEYNL